ncbi:unnamed protein product [Rotaria sp. Silwood1]|nr:unnamed protein product [Rotaria sp. Silwood1]CAF4573303.1 unnamed protein product [Rotaria sp. Silwood1]
MRFDRDPNRSPSRSPPPFHDENSDDNANNETELLASITEKETEMRHTQELLNERMRQAQITLAQLRQINQVLEEFKTLGHSHGNVNN